MFYIFDKFKVMFKKEMVVVLFYICAVLYISYCAAIYIILIASGAIAKQKSVQVSHDRWQS